MPSDSPVATAQRGLVLVVEDEPAIADVLRLNLRAAGYGVDVVGDGARHRATRALPERDRVDIGLPTLDGIEVCRRLRPAATGPRSSS